MKGNNPTSKTINDKIELVLAKLKNIETDLIREGKLYTAQSIKQIYEGKRLAGKGLIEVFDLSNRERRALQGIDLLEESTLYNDELWFRHAKEFINDRYKLDDFLLSDVDEDFLSEYKKWLTTKHKFGLAHIAKHLGSIKTVLTYGVRKKYIQNNPLQGTKIRRPNYADNEIIYLDEEQLERAEAHHFENPALQRILDVAIFQAHTALAWREAHDFEPGWIYKGIDGRPWISFIRQKTKKKKNRPTQIPLDAKAVELLDKYKGDLSCEMKGKCLPVPANQVMNRYLKVIAAALGLHPELSCHHFRKTAGMIWLNNDVPEETVAAMMGDSVDVVRKHYARVIEKKIARDMAKYSQRMNDKKYQTANKYTTQPINRLLINDYHFRNFRHRPVFSSFTFGQRKT